MEEAPKYHSWDCMDAYPGPCICGKDAPRVEANPAQQELPDEREGN